MNEDNTPTDHNPIYGDPFEVLIQHFRDNELRFSHDTEKRTASLSMQSHSGVMFNCRFRFDATGEVFQVDIHLPVLVQEKFRPVASEFLTRANWGLVVGNFGLDFSDGEVTYHASHIMDEGKLTDEIIARLFRTSLSTADRYWQGFMKVLYAGESPQEAVDLCELYRFEEESMEESDETIPPEVKPPTGPTTAKRNRRKPAKGSARKSHQKTLQQDLPSQPDPSSSGHQDTHPEIDGEGDDRKAA